MAYTRHLGQNGFRGVDFTSHPSMVSPDRFADALNVWKDYNSGQGSAIETFPGFRKIASAEGTVYGIFRYRVGSGEYLLAHIGKTLYYYDEDKKDLVGINDITLLALAEHKSQGFQFGDKYYVIDGKNYICIFVEKDKQGNDLIKAEKAEEKAYVPTTFINGTEHEQRNMLIDEEYQEYGPIKVGGSDGGYSFTFEDTTDYENIVKDYTCRITQCVFDGHYSSVIIVPEKVTIGENQHLVTSVGSFVFANNPTITKVIMPRVSVVGRYAFYNCPNLEEVIMYGSNLASNIINSSAFANCYLLNSVYVLGKIPSNDFFIRASAFSNAGKNVVGNKTTVIYEEGKATTGSFSISEIDAGADPGFLFASTTESPIPDYTLRIPIYSPCAEVLSVECRDTTKEINYSVEEYNDLMTAITITSDTVSLIGETIKIHLASSPSMFSSSNYTPFLSAQSGYGGTAQEAVLNCTVCAHFDGRVFFTGNPNLPNTVFYTNRDDTGHNNPFYIGTYNYFDTGIGRTPNTAMIASGSYLYVFKGDTVQDGSINLYQGVDGTDNILPRFYVRQQGLAGVGCLGAACNFNDDPVFISKRGLDAVGLQTVNLERTVQHRSTNVDRRLTQEDLSKAQLAEWEGYLVLLVPGGKVYLADSRQLFTAKAGHHEYEWYYLDGFCSYTDDETVYAFSSALPVTYIDDNELHLYETPDAIVDDPTKVMDYEDNKYIVIDGKYYSVYATGERSGGKPNEATCIVSLGDELLFGTSNGDICVINTDKRGVKPSDSYTDEEYKEYSDVISREWYTHMGHRYTSFVYLAQENAGVPHMAKNTVKKSVVVKAKDMFGSMFKWNVKTDRRPFGDVAEVAASMPDFGEFDFGLLVLDTTRDGSIIVINEKQKRYVEKQYAFFSDDFCRPFGIYHISYQYEIQGKVKNR